MILPEKMEELHKFLAEPHIAETIKEMLVKMMHSTAVVHRLIQLRDLAHVDPAIIDDMRTQGYALFERCSAMNALIHIIASKQGNDFIVDMFAREFIRTERDENSLRLLTKSTLATFAPDLLKEILE